MWPSRLSRMQMQRYPSHLGCKQEGPVCCVTAWHLGDGAASATFTGGASPAGNPAMISMVLRYAGPGSVVSDGVQ